ncbi:MAG: elongation factor P maturation arginine rhamnosyltransferase EarP [Thermotogota bacterium]
MKLAFFSKIIDNFGDAGFTIRLASAMSEFTTPEKITIYTDYKDLFYKLIPNTKLKIKNINEYDEKNDIIFFMFQYIPDQNILKKINKSATKAFIIDYFTTEDWASEANNRISFINGLKIPVEFIVPGLTQKSAGVLNYPINKSINKTKNNVYLYTPEKVLKTLKTGTIWGYKEDTNLEKMPFLPQKEFDSYVYGAKYNWIRGEDSFQLALNSGIPFFWEAYKQKNNIHHLKVNAFLDYINPFFEKYSKIKINYQKIINYLNDIEELSENDLHKILIYFEENYGIFMYVFENIKTHLQNKTNLQSFLIKKVTFL